MKISLCYRVPGRFNVSDSAMFVAEPFTARPGKCNPKDTVRGFKEILDGKHDSKNEQSFYMVGGIEEVK